MFCRNITSFICIFVGAVMATVQNDSHSVKGSDPEATVYLLTTGNPEPTVTAATRELQETAAGNLGQLLDARDDAVVTLVAGDTRLAAHRAVLEARSPVFKSMFAQESSDQFLVTDVESPVLRQLVAYCYTLQASQLLTMAPQLLSAADQLGISGLKDVSDQQTPTMRLGSLLNATDDAMVTLVAGETRLQAHRSILETRSPAFRSMFAQNASDPFLVTDVEGPVVRQLVAYCYTLQAPQLPEMALQLLAAAATYGLSDLKDACEQQVVGQLTVENAIEAGVLAVRHSFSTLKHATVAFLKDHIREVVMTQGWYAVMQRYPQDLLDLTQLILAPSPEIRTPATASHSTHRPPQSWAPAITAAPTAPSHAAPHDDDAIFRFRSLSPDEMGERLLQAAKWGAASDVKALLAAGADVGVREGGWTPLHWAAREGHEEVAKCLVEGGAEVDARTFKGQSTPLHLAAQWNNVAVVRLLLEASADPNARTEWGSTPLHRAAWYGQPESVTALLEWGADRGATNNQGFTPLDIARQQHHQHLFQLLTQ